MKYSGQFNILEWSPIDIAKQLTLISNNLFSKVEYKEFLNTNWTKKEKYLLAPNIMKIIERFNNLSLFIMEEVLAYDKKKHRAGVIEKFIDVAFECKNINNFNDCMTIISSLNSYIVKGLNKTWKVLNKQSSALFNNLNEFCSYEGNYANIRAELLTQKPCVPYLGLILKDLAFIEEGPKYINCDNLINLEKINKVAEVINFFLSHKNKSYSFKPVPQLLILSNPQPMGEDEIENLANKIGIRFLI
jgi:son of sevenless-like protein